MAAVEAAGVDLRTVGSNGYLENTFSILFADDLELAVDCLADFGVPQDLSDVRSGSKFGSRKPWNISWRRCCRILDTNMSQFEKVRLKASFLKACE